MNILGYEGFYTPGIQFLSLLSFLILLINLFVLIVVKQS